MISDRLTFELKIPHLFIRKLFVFVPILGFHIMSTLRQTPLTCSGHTRPVVHLAFSDINDSGYYMISACKGELAYFSGNPWPTFSLNTYVYLSILIIPIYIFKIDNVYEISFYKINFLFIYLQYSNFFFYFHCKFIIKHASII